MTDPAADHGIDMDVLLAVAARNQGLDPEQPSPSMSPTIAHLVTEIGPLIVHPLANGHDLRWLAAGLDALARAAEIAAHTNDTVTASTPRWDYLLRGDRVQVTGELRAAEPASATIGVPVDELEHLVDMLRRIAQDPAYGAWWDRNTLTQRFWHVKVGPDTVCAHRITGEYPDFPEAGRWRLRSAITLHLHDIAHLTMVLAGVLAGIRAVPDTEPTP